MDADRDRTGLESTQDYMGAVLGSVLPQALIRHAIGISVTTDGDVYERDDPVTITITITNRLPVPVAVRTPSQRLWGWQVDGKDAARDERVFTRETSGSHRFRAGEVKRIERTWNGRFQKRGADGVEWTPAAPGEHEIEAFLATEPGKTDSETIRIRESAAVSSG